jgi:ribosomal protein S18 acetylase RimI-like enzyme
MSIQITRPLPEDARGITTVLYKAWLATYPNEDLGVTIEDIEDSYRDSFTKENIQKSEEKLRNIPANQKRVIAKDGDLIIGMATMVRNNDNNQLRTIYVLPEYHRSGIGTMLWNAVKDFIDESKDTIVQVADYNQQAINFYEKLGFVDTGKRWKDERWKMRSGAYIPEMEMILKK